MGTLLDDGVAALLHVLAKESSSRKIYRGAAHSPDHQQREWRIEKMIVCASVNVLFASETNGMRQTVLRICMFHTLHDCTDVGRSASALDFSNLPASAVFRVLTKRCQAMMGIINVDSRFRTAYAAAEELGPPPRAEKQCQAGTRLERHPNLVEVDFGSRLSGGIPCAPSRFPFLSSIS